MCRRSRLAVKWMGRNGYLLDLDSPLHSVSDRRMTDSYSEAIGEMERMQDRLRAIRDRHCVPMPNANPRYLALSNAVSALNKAIRDVAEDGS